MHTRHSAGAALKLMTIRRHRDPRTAKPDTAKLVHTRAVHPARGRNQSPGRGDSVFQTTSYVFEIPTRAAAYSICRNTATPIRG